jgi:hypothetical protein
MPFHARDLSVLAYANGFTLWHYRTADGLDALLRDDADGYFAAARDLLRPGDQIIVNVMDTAGQTTANLAVAAGAAGGPRVRRMASQAP